jgi:hypothetical protein
MEEGTLLANMQLGFIFRNYSSRIDIWREELFTEEKGMKTPFARQSLGFGGFSVKIPSIKAVQNKFNLVPAVC